MFEMLYRMQDQWHNVLHGKVLRSMLQNGIQEELFSNNPTQVASNSLQIKKVAKKPYSASSFLCQRLAYYSVNLPNYLAIMI